MSVSRVLTHLGIPCCLLLPWNSIQLDAIQICLIASGRPHWSTQNLTEPCTPRHRPEPLEDLHSTSQPLRHAPASHGSWRPARLVQFCQPAASPEALHHEAQTTCTPAPVTAGILFLKKLEGTVAVFRYPMSPVHNNVALEAFKPLVFQFVVIATVYLEKAVASYPVGAAGSQATGKQVMKLRIALARKWKSPMKPWQTATK